MMFNNNKMRVIAASVAMASLLNSSAIYAGGIKDVLDKMFSDMMSGSTPPSTQKVMGRHAFAGGSYQTRAKIIRPKFINITPPNIKAGCGGISAYGGAFSFISAAQFKQLLNAIAQNATGYAFQLALNTLCPSCNNIMARLADKISSLGQSMGDSCKIATSLVDALPSSSYASTIRSKTEKWSQDVAGWGGYNDFYEAYKDPLGALNKASSTFINAELKGNIAYNALKKANVKDWFASTSVSDDDLYVFIIGMTGTQIKSKGPSDDQSNASDGPGSAKQQVAPETLTLTSIEPTIHHIEELVRGDNNGNGTLTVVGCPDAECTMELTSPLKTLDFPGTLKYVNKYLFGSDDGNNPSQVDGIVAHLSINANQDMKPEEWRFYWSLTPLERRALSAKRGNFETIKSYAQDIAERVAWREAFRMYLGVMKGAKAALTKATKDEDLLSKLKHDIQEFETNAQNEYARKMVSFGAMTYNHIQAARANGLSR